MALVKKSCNYQKYLFLLISLIFNLCFVF
ncbi:hypothetical protein Avbf_14598 [Armadillidium vulgare]|nr:hypothetical protein Avbf_14598 [Armadillidium vulgare]